MRPPRRIRPDSWDDWYDGPPAPPHPRTTNVETTDPTIRKLYGPNGEVLLTVSDRPPVGFHQGHRR